MKKLIWILIITVISLKIHAQLPVPQLCAVSVDTAGGYPVLYWTISDTSAIDGFIIKRVIYGGTGVIDGTLNNIAVIPTDTVKEFSDTSTAYNTTARADIRAEKYVVVAYDTSGGQTVYSGFSRELSTIHLQASYDSCANVIRLQWTTNQAIKSYTVLYSSSNGINTIAHTTDTSLVFIPPDNGNYTFVVQAALKSACLIDSIFSNKASVIVRYYQRPRLLYIHSLEASFDDSIKITLHITMRNPAARVELKRDSSTVAEFDSDFDGYIFDPVATDTVHTYRLYAYSACGQVIATSNIARNIIIHGQARDRGDTRLNSLSWTSFPYWAGTTLNYTIYTSRDGHNFSPLASTTDTSYNHNLHDDIINGFLPPDYYYYIAAQEINDTLIWQNATASSNIIKITQQPLLHLPNTINPLSPNPEDRQFRVYADFMQDFQLVIYDRYGRIVFQSHTPEKSWDGHLPDGQLAPRDVYFYVIKYTNGGKKEKVHGTISIVY